MAEMLSDDPVLARFRAALEKSYGHRVERAVLYGSRARGDMRTDSDYDVAVFLTDMTDRGQELDRLADMSTEILYELGGCIHALAYPAGADMTRSPLMHEIRNHGRDL